jgi:hypothetical protein
MGVVTQDHAIDRLVVEGNVGHNRLERQVFGVFSPYVIGRDLPAYLARIGQGAGGEGRLAVWRELVVPKIVGRLRRGDNGERTKPFFVPFFRRLPDQRRRGNFLCPGGVERLQRSYPLGLRSRCLGSRRRRGRAR